MSTQDIVQKLWNLCNVLRDDGITYHQYVTELTYILFLKMADETGADKDIPEAYRWGSLTSRSGIDLKKHYYTLLSKLGEESVGRVAQIYANASSSIEEPKNLEKIITEIDKLDWYEAKEEGLGDLYEGLLEKNANEKKSGAGQYFTPRVLIDVMTELIKPQLGDKCFDPACGTFGFMIAANRYVNANNDSYFQNANTETAVVWRDWKYKVGDHILFNDTDRFSLLYNNLKGRIVQIELFDSRIRFTVDVEIPLTEQDCQNDGIEFIDIIDDVTRIRFDVFDFEEEMADEDRKKAIVPFQLAYAVSIHKAQGLEYRSVKVVIPSSNAEKITHGIFYTAITRAKEKLKIYWSSETMQEVVAGFSIDTSRQKSLAIIKEKLKQDKNT